MSNLTEEQKKVVTKEIEIHLSTLRSLTLMILEVDEINDSLRHVNFWRIRPILLQLSVWQLWY